MAMIFEVVYPGGERTYAIGYPGTTVVVNQVPPGPESCMYDELEIDFSAVAKTPSAACPVLRLVGGPRRPTHRVRVPGGEPAREAWMSAREAEGWDTLDGHEADEDIVWVVASRDGLDESTLDGLIPR
jgi:hypothetical protein